MPSSLLKRLFKDKSVTPGPPYTDAQFFNSLQDAVIDAGGSSDSRPLTAHNHDTIYPPILASVSALRALTGGVATVIRLIGYNAGSGEGGGLFRLDTSNTATADDGGTVFVDADLRRWKRVLAGRNLTPGMFGAVPNDPTAATANLTAFQNALNSGVSVGVPSGNWYIDGGLKIPNFAVLEGSGFYGNSDSDTVNAATKLIFVGSHPVEACFSPQNTTTPLVHFGFSDMVFRATGDYAWIWDLKTVVGWKMSSTRSETTSTTCGGIRAKKINPADSSWVINWWDVQVRLPDASTARTIDADFSDGVLAGGSSSGAAGAIFRGAGGLKLLGGRYDRSNGSAITLSIEHESKSPYIIEGCEIEENSVNGILLDADALDSRVETWVMPVINGCYFRNYVAGSADIRFKNTTGNIIHGGVVGSNSHISTAVPIARDVMRWQDVTILPGAVYSKSGHNSYAGGQYLQSPLVLGQSGGMVTLTNTTVETVLATIAVPGDVMLSNGRLKVMALWNTSSSGNAKNLRIKFGGTIFRNVAVSATTQTAAQLMTDIQNRNNPAAQVATGGSSLGGAEVVSGILVGSIDTRVSNNIEIVGQLANATDIINLQAYLVELIPAQ